ncbi:trypsin-like serine protease [Streptomyces sp. NPDC002088]|uniref:trypsin-like serine protease n=1 Tax=Streptomyces sp. NPDC002088 TaxID=3154665 RepID=UPI003316B2F8
MHTISPSPRPRPSRARLRAGALAVALVAAPLTALAVPAAAVTGSAATTGSLAYTARLDIGDGTRACSGALVDPEWLLTAASCFVDDPAAGLDVTEGAPPLATTATIGRTDLTTSTGEVRTVTKLVPRTDRDMVLAKLSRPVTSVTPVALSSTAATAGESLTVAGYGRTTDEWSPLTLHTGTFTVDSTATTTTSVTGQDGAAVCAGDTGGPEVRGSGTSAALVAISSQSWQGGCFGQDSTETRTGAVSTRVDDLASWVTDTAAKTDITDFNGDGVEDIAVSDPEATVNSKAKAGVVRVVYGGGAGVLELNQDLDEVAGGTEAGDQFGTALATVDYNEDGYTDLVVGTPNEAIGTDTAAGFVDVIYGSADGLGQGTHYLHLEEGGASTTGSLLVSSPEAGDEFGAALAAGTTAAGEPYIVIGTPGEGLDGEAEAGEAFYLRGSTSTAIYQGKSTVSGTAEAGDHFGASVAADKNHIAIGDPGEAIGTAADAGGVQILSHTLNADGIPTPIAGVAQSDGIVSGAAEAGDEFGASLSVTDYRTSSSTSDSLIAVGSPGEDLDNESGVSQADGGRVVILRVTAAGAVSYTEDIHQDDTDVQGAIEAGDRFGAQVTAVNTAPRAVGSAATMHLAVGIPGEAIGTVAGAGAVQTFSLLGEPGDSDFWIQAGNASGLPGTPGTDQQVGASIHATGTSLYIGMPYGPSTYGALHVLPWSNATGGTVATVTTYAPGSNGLPATGVRFGYAAR